MIEAPWDFGELTIEMIFSLSFISLTLEKYFKSYNRVLQTFNKAADTEHYQLKA